MHIKGLGVDVIINDIQSNPKCTHGPTILFERFYGNGRSKSYFACSACRDKKDCSYHHQADQKISQFKIDMWEDIIKRAAPKMKHEDLYERLTQVKKLPAMERSYCLSCSELLIPKKKKTEHENCNLKSPLFDSMLSQPSQFLPPLENTKYEAQYLFSQNSMEVLMGMLKQIDAKKVLCVGSPRIFEAINSSEDKQMSSLLMDIDNRYAHFFSPSKFVRYNMFNHHFFEGDQAKETFKKFITGNDKLVLVTDPPFGGKVELLAHNMKTIQKEWKAANNFSDDKQLSVLFIFPYFMEPQVLEYLPNFVMLDYQVDYDNYAPYSSGPKAMFIGSPVRVYVNDRPSLFVLPDNKGYKMCEPCDRWVRSTNTHCEKCKGCMSKDGRTYQHCDTCEKCVKPTLSHCSECDKCHMQDHDCQEDADTPKDYSCHSCGEEGHRRKDCTARKRSLDTIQAAMIKKRKIHNASEENVWSFAVASEKSKKNSKNESKAKKKNEVQNEIKIKNNEQKQAKKGKMKGEFNNEQNKMKKGKMNGEVNNKQNKMEKEKMNGDVNSKQNKMKKGKRNGQENKEQKIEKKGKMNGKINGKENNLKRKTVEKENKEHKNVKKRKMNGKDNEILTQNVAKEGKENDKPDKKGLMNNKSRNEQIKMTQRKKNLAKKKEKMNRKRE